MTAQDYCEEDEKRVVALPSLVITGSGLSPCKAPFNYSPSPSSSILNAKRWKGKGEYGISHPDLTAAVRDSFGLRGLVLQLEDLWHSLVGIRPWPFPFPWKQRMQTCSLLHKYSKCYGGAFNRTFFPSFSFFLRWWETANAQEKREDCRGTQFLWASCHTYVQEIECKNYCVRGC